jgi:pimeloyl-ACP methyl ester carboxylesterase
VGGATLGSRLLATLAIALAAFGCTDDRDAPGPVVDSPGATASEPAELTGATGAEPEDPHLIEGSFDVGGHSLYLRCTGFGSPTVVYLHGYIFEPSDGSSENVGQIPDLIRGRQVCVYDRANVGRSDSVEGPLTGEDAVEDLHALLAAAEVQPPYAFLASSFGALLADIYAASYPGEIIAMIQLDPNVPGEIQIMERFLPETDRIQPDEWETTTEQIDRLATYEQARVLEGRLPDIPMYFLGSRELVADPRMDAALRKLQAEFVAGFAPGRLIRRFDLSDGIETTMPGRVALFVGNVIAIAGYTGE